MILSCQSISKSFGTDEILKDVSFHIEANEKAAIVGINGAGKSTLLKIIMGEETSDAGEVILAKDKTIGYPVTEPSMMRFFMQEPIFWKWNRNFVIWSLR